MLMIIMVIIMMILHCDQNFKNLNAKIDSRPPCAPDWRDPPRQRTRKEEIETWEDYK